MRTERPFGAPLAGFLSFPLRLTGAHAAGQLIEQAGRIEAQRFAPIVELHRINATLATLNLGYIGLVAIKPTRQFGLGDAAGSTRLRENLHHSAVAGGKNRRRHAGACDEAPFR